MVGKKVIYLVIGVLATMVAIIGVFLPGIPTTFPTIIALWAFSRSSRRLGRGLDKIPLLRVALAEARRYEDERTVALKAKIVSQSCAWGSTILLALLTQNIIITGVAASIAVVCSVFMYITPTTAPEASLSETEVALADSETVY